MTRTRIALTTFVAFFVSQVMAVLIHGFVLAADYEPFDGTLLRSGADAWQFIFLPVAHLAFICGLVWVYTHAQLTGSRARQGLTLGVVVVGYRTGSGMAVVVRGTAMARIARRKATRTRARIVAADRIHDRLHRPAIGVCAGTRDCTKMSPPEDGSTGSLT